MSLITYVGLCELVARGIITGVEPDRINAASIDVTLGRAIWQEDTRGGIVDLAAKQTPGGRMVDIGDDGYLLMPGEFILAQTRETFNLPAGPDVSISAEFRLKSSGARAGLDQALAVWCDPGWNGSVLTLELRNNLQHHSLLLREGMKIGQMVFYAGATVPDERSYATIGRYNGDTRTSPSRGIQ